MEKINQKDYKYYVFDLVKSKINTGWEFRSDAQDALDDLGSDSQYKKIYTGTYLKHSLHVDPEDNNNWG